MDFRIFVIEVAAPEGGEVAVDGCCVLPQLTVDGGKLLVAGANGLVVGFLELGDGLVDDVVAGGVEVEQGLADSVFQFLGVERWMSQPRLTPYRLRLQHM